MKKIILGLLVVAIVWGGSSYLIGARVETLYTEALADMEVLPGQEGLRFRVVEYRRGIFSSKVRACLSVDESLSILAELSGYVCDKSTFRHGPLMWTSTGPWMGLAFSHGELDMAPLPEEIRSVIAEMLGDNSPLYAEMWLSFDGSARVRAWVPEFSIALAGVNASLGRLELDAYMTALDSDTGKVFLTLRDLDISSDAGADLAIGAIDMALDVTDMIEGVLPLMQVKLQAAGIRAGRSARQPWEDDTQVSFDMALEATSELKGDALSGEMSLWLTEVHAESLTDSLADSPIMMPENVYMALTYRGIDLNAAIRFQQISDEIDRLQTQMMMSMFAEPGDEPVDFSAEAVFEQMSALTEEMMVVVSERLMRPGETGATLRVLLDRDDIRQLSLDMRVDYEGINGANLPLDELTSLDEAQLLQLANASLSADADATLLSADLSGFIDDRLVSAGLATLENGRYGVTLALQGGELVFNGETLAASDVMERLSTLRMGGDEITLQEIEACYEDYADISEVPEYCLEFGLYPYAEY
ncbi:MAG: YdgA family protein [Alcanivorax sp.]|nr:YdgA family protein [Alcanivorax sp.]